LREFLVKQWWRINRHRNQMKTMKTKYTSNLLAVAASPRMREVFPSLAHSESSENPAKAAKSFPVASLK
jgi:hypothetical protein